MNIVIAEGRLPIGAVHFAVDAGDDHLVALGFADQWPSLRRRLGADQIEHGDPLGMADRLTRYGRGQLDAFDGVPVRPSGTDFQRRVWTILQRIAAGTTWSYLDVARALGAPSATRAVGAANGQNPISLVIPCHRVIRGDGALSGYAGGVDKKRWLLDHEHKAAPKTLPFAAPMSQ